MIVVSDTSPLRALAHLQSVELLKPLYGEVLVPPAVESELSHPPGNATGLDLGAYEFIQVEAPLDGTLIEQFRQTLDPGESEALALALERKAAVVLIDEADGRQAATESGLSVVGTLGILLRAKENALIPEIRSLLDNLEEELGFFVSGELRAEVLKIAGE